MKLQFLKHNFFLLVLLLFSSAVYSQYRDSRLFNDSTLQISEIGINTSHSDFGPFVVQDTLYFTTFNDKLLGKTNKTLRKSEFYDLYKSAIDKDGNPIDKRLPVTEFITEFNDGPVAWCPKTGELFITQNYKDPTRKPKRWNEINKLRIIIAKQENGKWTNITDFSYNNPEYSVGHPAVTVSGDTLVFSSDRPGGFGETDLYMSIRSNGKWGIPVNMGPKINTSGKEEFAFLTDEHFNGQYLIFSSKGRFGNGGFDLYYTPFPSDYTEIGHFDPPLNTKYDDFAMTIPTDGEYGYLTSNRPGTGDDDIYKFNFKRLVNPDGQDAHTIPASNQGKCRSLYVFDQSSGHPIPGVRIVSCDKQYYITDGKGKVACIPCNGSSCEVIASTFGYPDKAKVLTQCRSNYKGIISDTIWMDIRVNTKIALKNIYYDFDKWDILEESAKELDQLVALMKENPGMKVELGSHTDDRGTDIYNLKLSDLRAQSAVNYVISKGIDKSRITGTGYGKSQLIHKGVGDQKCTPEQNRENRRTEIYIPGFLRGESVKQRKGDYSDGRPDATSDYSSAREHGDLVAPDQKTGIEQVTKEKPSPEKVKSVPAATEVTKTVKPETAAAPVKSPAIPKVKGSLVVSAPNARYYIILGSFETERKAQSVQKQVRNDNYEAIIIKGPKKYKVGIGFRKLSETRKELEILKEKYEGAWIYTK